MKHGNRLPPEDTGPQQAERGDIATRFKPGESGNPAGRPKGSRNKLSQAVFDDVCAHWEAHGLKAIEKTCKTNPGLYFRVVASLLPQHVKIEHEYANMSDEQLEQRRREIEAAIAAELGQAKAMSTSVPTEADTKH
jgi:hypothetical protein